MAITHKKYDRVDNSYSSRKITTILFLSFQINLILTNLFELPHVMALQNGIPAAAARLARRGGLRFASPVHPRLDKVHRDFKTLLEV